jgi:hypothetical protein
MCNIPGGGHGGGHGHGFGHGGHGSGCCTFHGMGHHGSCLGGGWRRFMSPAEELERLHNYLAELKNEVAGVEARIHELKAK